MSKGELLGELNAFFRFIRFFFVFVVFGTCPFSVNRQTNVVFFGQTCTISQFTNGRDKGPGGRRRATRPACAPFLPVLVFSHNRNVYSNWQNIFSRKISFLVGFPNNEPFWVFIGCRYATRPFSYATWAFSMQIKESDTDRMGHLFEVTGNRWICSSHTHTH